MTSRFNPTCSLYLLTILGSIVLSAWFSVNHLINNDGVLYLEAAQRFLQQGIGGAMVVYGWPFYSILIALVHKFTHLPLEQAALVLNGFLYIVIALGFLQLVKALGGHYQVQVFAAMVILLHTGLNDYRDYIIRDFGHWAFMLYALYFLIRYAEKPRWYLALGWNLCILIAFLFRTEALLVMIFAPLALLLPHPTLNFRYRLLQALGAYALLVLGGVLLIVAYFVDPHLVLSAIGSNPWLQPQWDSFGSAIAHQFTGFRQAIPPYVKNNELVYMIVGGLLSYFGMRIILLLSPFYTFLTGYSLYNQCVQPSLARRMVITFIIIYVLIVLSFLFYRFFLTGRYLMPIVLLLTLWSPFALSMIYDHWRVRKTWLFPVMLGFFAYMFGDSVVSSAPSQLYLKDAGYWIAETIPKTARVCTNNVIVGHYARNASTLDNALINFHSNNCDYLALVTKKDDQGSGMIIQAEWQPIQVFENSRGEKVMIYQIAQGRNRTGTGD